MQAGTEVDVTSEECLAGALSPPISTSTHVLSQINAFTTASEITAKRLIVEHAASISSTRQKSKCVIDNVYWGVDDGQRNSHTATWA